MDDQENNANFLFIFRSSFSSVTPKQIIDVICFAFADDIKLISEKQCNSETVTSSLSTWGN